LDAVTKSPAQPESFAKSMFALPVSPWNLATALLAGLALRLFFVIHFPFSAGDTKFYGELARNWLDHGVYGLFVKGQLVPTDMRAPGYPAFLAAIYAIFGRSGRAVLVVQAIVDLMTCVATALIAARLPPAAKRATVATAALWIAALCPFTANYAAVFLTESLAIFSTTFALLIFVSLLDHPFMLSDDDPASRGIFSFVGWIIFAGFLVGLGTLVRPETPLVLAAAGLVFCARLRRSANWRKLILTVSWMAVGLLLPLMPWAVRNARTMGRIEFLAPRYAEVEGDFIPRGVYAWTRTWMVRFDDAYLVPWKLGKAPITAESLPPSAFDSPAERAKVNALLNTYDSDLKMTPLLDRQFAVLASERTARHPLRTYLFVPAARAWAMWFTPPVAFLRYSGQVWPLSERWRDNRPDLVTTLGFTLLSFIYAGLALVGAWTCRARSGFTLLAAFIIIRTVVLTQMQTIEPRYIIVCLPALLAICAQAWALSRQSHAASVVEPRWTPNPAAADSK
jgi:hypothetical protein